MSRGLTARTLALVAVLLAVAVPAAAESAAAGSPPSTVPANTLIPSVGILTFRLGSRPPVDAPLTPVGTGMYRSLDHGVPLLVWRSASGIVGHVEAQQAGPLSFDGHQLSAGYRVFRTLLTPQGWRSFACGAGVRGLMLTSRSRTLTFVLWNGRSASASISLPSQSPVFGVCGALDRPPAPVG